MLEVHPQLLLYQGIIFLVFVFLMRRFVYKSLVKMVEGRRCQIENTIIETERKRGEVESLRLGYEGRVSEIAARADEILRQAEAEGREKYNEIVETGRAEAARVADNTRRRAESDIEDAVLAAKDDLVGIAAELARKALGGTVTPEVDARLLQELQAELPAQEWKE
jgi:F-type H+-transporting ATPase subunit b